MYKALVDSEAFSDQSLLEQYELKETYEENWPGEIPEILHISKLVVQDDQLDTFKKAFSSKKIKDGWFTVIWNEKRLFVLLKQKVFELENIDPWNQAEFNELTIYGQSHDIDRKYFENMRSVMNKW